MARKSDSARAGSGEDPRPSVELESPDGQGSTSVSTPTAFTNLVYGSGYRPVGGQSIEEALAVLQGPQDVEGAPNPGPVTSPVEPPQ